MKRTPIDDAKQTFESALGAVRDLMQARAACFARIRELDLGKSELATRRKQVVAEAVNVSDDEALLRIARLGAASDVADAGIAKTKERLDEIERELVGAVQRVLPARAAYWAQLLEVADVAYREAAGKFLTAWARAVAIAEGCGIGDAQARLRGVRITPVCGRDLPLSANPLLGPREFARVINGRLEFQWTGQADVEALFHQLNESRIEFDAAERLAFQISVRISDEADAALRAEREQRSSIIRAGKPQGEEILAG